LAGGKVTSERYAACGHVVASQIGEFNDAIDAALEEVKLSRAVQVVVPGFSDAMRVAASSDLIELVPRTSLGNTLVDNRAAAMEIQQFDLPVRTPEILISALWHPRVDTDPAQRWLRQVVISLCKRAYPPT
jgi:DNA-binding transcriptional LysR family regulator